MANTYVLIASIIASGGETAITFSSIPSTYTDLVLKVSARESSGTGTVQALRLQLNNDTNTNYSNTTLLASGTSVSSSRSTSQTTIFLGQMVGAAATTNTFNNLEIYIPNYTTTVNKAVGIFNGSEDNSTSGNQLSAIAGLYRGSSAISTIQIQPNGKQFAANSSFYLYGIKNS